MVDELWHHGIFGMHWGEKNGPPYPLKQSQKTTEEKNYSIKYRKPSTMTNEELRDAISRMEAEEKYKNTYNRVYPKKKTLLSKVGERTKKTGASFLSKALFDPLAAGLGKKLTNSIVGDSEVEKQKKELADFKKEFAAYKDQTKQSSIDKLADVMANYYAGKASASDVAETVVKSESSTPISEVRSSDRTETGSHIIYMDSTGQNIHRF